MIFEDLFGIYLKVPMRVNIFYFPGPKGGTTFKIEFLVFSLHKWEES